MQSCPDPNTTILYEMDKMREYKWLTTRSNAVSTYPKDPLLTPQLRLQWPRYITLWNGLDVTNFTTLQPRENPTMTTLQRRRVAAGPSRAAYG